LFFGFFLPGDSLLFTAGILAAKDFFDPKIVLFGTFLCAFLGDQVGYWTGRHFGATFFSIGLGFDPYSYGVVILSQFIAFVAQSSSDRLAVNPGSVSDPLYFGFIIKL